ncbi:LysR family transcriptional regulator [Cohaesibacter celericrescens]|uniref:LysR family transcriptional regulator n=1 Tax=Cohaesibacter celericrescens TaxID=2067669 RepID=A0A2N5XNV4_9HYPH|nr:LysR family transcriptional regulator [Cohaesibacter celericrescens]PLW76097.1 LysR family transcriptional regulator [Cohaesibacter celericrescens]
MHGIEIRHLRYFLRVADELHFGRAAEMLGISQAPLSQQIRQLEDRLGVRLFDRTTRSVQLTPAGRIFANKAETLMASFSDAIDETRMAGGLGSGVLRIGAMAPAVHSVLPMAFSTFNRKFPSARLDMRLHTTEEQLELLASRAIDIALMRPPRVASGLETREIFREGFVAVIHETSDLAKLKQLTVKDLKEESFISYTEIRGIGYQDIVNQHCRKAGYLPRVVQRVSHTIGVITLVAAGLGVGIVPAWVINEPVKGVCYRPLTELPRAVTLVCAWRSDTMNPLVAPFARELLLASDN